MSRVYLSPPHLGEEERRLVEEAFDSNWIAPLGPHVDAFERELGAIVDMPHVAALSSGTAALHLALRLLGVGPRDEVLCSDLTFAASAFPILYQAAAPVFVDVTRETWQVDPVLLAEELEDSARRGRAPKAAVIVDLYGQSADWRPVIDLCDRHGVAVVEDAAEGLGARYGDRPAGSFGDFSVFSFNGNKILTTSGGGALASRDGEAIERARKLAAQARDPAAHYQHSEVGYNYRLSNVLAAIGRGQLAKLDDRVAARRAVCERYQEGLADLPGIRFMPEASYGRASRWLTCLTIQPHEFGADRETVRRALESEDIESRPVWKPMHLQPVFSGCRFRGSGVSKELFELGLCLPSGSSLAVADQDRVIGVVRRCCADG